MFRPCFDAFECLFVLVDAFRPRDALTDAPRDAISARLRRAGVRTLTCVLMRFGLKNCVVATSYSVLVATTSISTSKSVSRAPRRPDSIVLRPSFRPETSRRPDVYSVKSTKINENRRKRTSVGTNARPSRRRYDQHDDFRPKSVRL